MILTTDLIKSPIRRIIFNVVVGVLSGWLLGAAVVLAGRLFGGHELSFLITFPVMAMLSSIALIGFDILRRKKRRRKS